MPEANIMLFDGSVTIAPVAPASTTRTGGHIVLDLWENAPNGLIVALVLARADPPGACEMVSKVQCSDTLAFIGQGREEILIGGGGAPTAVQNNDMPGVFMKRVSTKRRYLRVRIDAVSHGANFGTVYILAIPFPFEKQA